MRAEVESMARRVNAVEAVCPRMAQDHHLAGAPQ
jgi:vacuolar-type H+-ATPase subunit D/Vma8